MSARLMADIFHAKNLLVEQKMFLMVLANNANDQGFGEISILDLSSFSGIDAERCFLLIDAMVSLDILSSECLAKPRLMSSAVKSIPYRLTLWNITNNKEPQL